MTPAELLRLGIEAAHAGRGLEARDLFMQVVELEPRNEMAWMWLTGYVDDLEDKIIACENVLAINPANDKIKAYLGTLLRQRQEIAKADEAVQKSEPVTAPVVLHPKPAGEKTKGQDLLSTAEQLEEEGQIEEALKAYELLAAKAKDSQLFDHAYKQITRLENLQKEKIRHFSPMSSILRLTCTWPLVYVSFALVQNGLHPFLHLIVYLWLGFPFVLLGSLLLALSEVRIRHAIWQKVFMEEGNGSTFARIVLAVTGWIFILVPFGLIFADALARLQNFQIPPEPR